MQDGPLYNVEDPEMMEIMTQQRELPIITHGKTAQSLRINNGDNAVSTTTAAAPTVATTAAPPTTAAASSSAVDVDVDVIENNMIENHKTTTPPPRQLHPPTLSVPTDFQPQAPTSSIPSGKRGNIRQVHAMARLAVPAKSKIKPPTGIQPKQPKQQQPQPQQQQSQQTPSQLKPQPPSSSKGLSRPSQPHIQPRAQRRRSYVMAESGVGAEGVGKGEEKAGGGGEGMVGIDVTPAISSDAPTSTPVVPMDGQNETVHSKEKSSSQPSIQPIPQMMATETSTTGIPQIGTPDVDTNNGLQIMPTPTMPATTLPSSSGRIHVPDWDETLHKRKVQLQKHTVKKRVGDTSAVVKTAVATTVATAVVKTAVATAVTATATTARVGTVKPLHKPQPPTKPKSHVNRSISTSSRPPPISITDIPVPPSNISPLSSPSALPSPLPSSSSPKKSPLQNVLPGEQRRMQLENRLKLIKREAALRRSQQQTQTNKTTQPPSQQPQQSPQQQQPQQRQPNEVDNGAEYYTQLSSNEVGSQGVPALDGDESVETITMSVC